MNQAPALLKFLNLVGSLKHLPRTGWVLRDVPNPETVSGHMYRMAMTTFILEDPSLDKHKCMEMALVHDLAESIIGDITPICNVSKKEKQKKELAAMEEIANLIDFLKEYETQETAEAQFVKDMDLFDMALQAFEYEKKENRPGWLQEFFDSTNGRFKHPEILKLVEQLYIDRAAHMASLN